MARHSLDLTGAQPLPLDGQVLLVLGSSVHLLAAHLDRDVARDCLDLAVHVQLHHVVHVLRPGGERRERTGGGR